MASFKIKECHWEVLMAYMEEHKDFANGRFLGLQGRETQRKMWSTIANRLNALGYGERSAEKWQKTWADFKHNLKKKGQMINSDLHGTGGGGHSSAPFNSFELRALNIFGGKTFYAGAGSTELGILSPSISQPKANTTPESLDFKKPNTSAEPQPSPWRSFNKTLATRKQTTRVTTDYHDHDYEGTPPTKKKKDHSDEAYRETIDILKEIKETIHQGLSEIKEVLDSRLQQIAEGVNSGK
ncbi:unnamed protein product [Ceutorhynchus assimilis]|uniref:Regulatory protein zeste n=1 Tax=Ceutorhynchus assimilis TaxID=467358 RepID=A0A9N9QSF7_9CUCU|nr:unnamed protein product [Ceutorhynchus assimilis]